MSRLHPEFAAICENHLGIATPAMRVRYTGWRLNENGRESTRCLLNADTLDEAVALMTPGPMPAAVAKGGFPAFVILESDERAGEGQARHKLNFYTVKVKRQYRGTAMFAVPYAAPSGSLAMNAFEPRRPFDALRDCPANGRQPGEGELIEIGRRG